jgi:hypothetical protein
MNRLAFTEKHVSNLVTSGQTKQTKPSSYVKDPMIPAAGKSQERYTGSVPGLKEKKDISFQF